ncbi:L-aspartate oxidase [Bacteroidota bacterium]
MTKHKYDFLVIGTGLAGLSTALYASKFGKVALLTKSKVAASTTYRAQGGIAAAIGKDDLPEYHFHDTIRAGVGLCNEKAVDILVKEGIDRINELIGLGMTFDREDSKIALGLEGGHSKRRVLHAGGDATGREIINFLTGVVNQNKSIDVHEKSHVFDLAKTNEECLGVYAFNIDSKETCCYISKCTIVASGGASGIFSRTTNPHSSTGDGVIIAYNGGAKLSDMEFIQFHPTSLSAESGNTFLISEAVRGEGAYLINSDNKRFMLEAHNMAELAPRDVVSYEMFKQLKQEGNKVFLKLDHLDGEKIKKRFTTIYNEIKKFGFDLTKDLIPVAPAAHYMIGGIKTGFNGETNIKNLYACGEVSCTGIHGANRLASNSLLECLVFSKRSVDHYLNKTTTISEKDNVPVKKYVIDPGYENLFVKLRNQISEAMTEHVGVVRSEEYLNLALDMLDNINKNFISKKDEYFSMRFNSLINICELITKSSLLRVESRGNHRREDFPESNLEFLVNIVVEIGKTPTFEFVN